MDIKILYEDESIIVVVKPPGMASQNERGSSMDMPSRLKNHLSQSRSRQRPEGRNKTDAEPYIAVVHRLDKPVGGVMVYAKNKKAAASLSQQFANDKNAGKQYIAVLSGRLPKPEGILTDHLRRRPEGNVSEVVPENTEGAKRAVLEYKVLLAAPVSEDEGETVKSLVRIQLLTGRHHQIRVQMAHAGAGVWGDTKYNHLFRDMDRSKRYGLALFADKLSFVHPRTGKTMTFTAVPGEEITGHFKQEGAGWKNK